MHMCIHIYMYTYIIYTHIYMYIQISKPEWKSGTPNTHLISFRRSTPTQNHQIVVYFY